MVKRSVSMGDNALTSNALLNSRQPSRQGSLRQNTVSATAPIVEQKKNSPPVQAAPKHENPVGEANFTLHAQACPVTMRRKPVQNLDANTKARNSSNDDSMETSSRRDSKLSTTSDSAQTTFYESQDSLNPPMSPMSMDGRMTKSEYVFRDSGE